MLRGLGATVTAARAPFTPEGGAYGMGRTMGHEH
jgi:urease accessory protein